MKLRNVKFKAHLFDKPLNVTISAIILGIGIYYGVHVHERYKEEKQKGFVTVKAVKTNLCQKPRPIMA